MERHYCHLHLISDATGETLIAVSRAVAAQYQGVSSLEHIYPLVRTRRQLERVINEIAAAPGMVLFTLVDQELAHRLEEGCKEIGAPCLSVLQPILNLFQSYLGAPATPRPGAQHMLNADYFRRIDALNFTLMHDDGQQSENYEAADVLLIGVSRTSKTPTSIYLANRGVKTANIPFVPDVPLPKSIESLRKPLVVGLLATPDSIVQVRRMRLLSLDADQDSPYVDRHVVADEVAQSRKLFERRGWATIDVTRRSIEETAAAIIDLYNIHRLKFISCS
ncbi:pyruvate, water dikinase regulatory protein [Methylocapsa polymorpha]|uniref:Putative pyruvate, phosphate dikinase regulatory protein n=1 Tax=Methylocapsa polymorpha TaxID=3080828 RepID=A0ABZ0HX52_9HYPH|nr:pyruvate, water dikinase regulatory protein [Methylocapsa sp. RX1]